ncbi:MAG TPA: HEAT repeat domain-containing protein [Vicinamibacterales bacterium]|nr:HEAT repeat domain-containing protein [Vicinamibacterales bacterium]
MIRERSFEHLLRRSSVHLHLIAGTLGVLALALMASPVAAQPHIQNARIETRSAANGLEREVERIASSGATTWIGYSVPMVPGNRLMCCGGCGQFGDGSRSGCCRLDDGTGVTMIDDGFQRSGSTMTLEPPTEFFVLARVERGSVTRLRTFTPDCQVDGGGATVVWLDNVRPADSVAWLSSLVTAAPPPERGTPNVGKQALIATSLHRDPAADSALERFVAPNQPEWLRRETPFWLGSARGEPGARVLARMIAPGAGDPSDSVRDKVTFGLSVSKQPIALTTLIAAARQDHSAHVRGQALFWLGQKAGKEAVGAITDAIDQDPETAVKKKAVFALSQLPKDDGIPKLIEVARTNKNPEVRKQAMFWLGQSKDPRAISFFEEILTRR